MYYFTYNGYEYRIRFQYHHLDEPAIHQRVVGKESKYRHSSVAIIEAKDDGKWNPTIVGESWCSIQDQFEKSVGRKYALRRLAEGLDKPFRAAIFQAVYHHQQSA